jgi:tRNA modification GTPase
MYELEPAMAFEKTLLPHPDDTIVAVSSAPGPGLRAIVRLSGPNTRAVIATCFQAREGATFQARRVVPGSIRLSDVHSPLPATLYFFPGPRSYTGQDLAELHISGSQPLVERLVTDLLAAGARSAQPGEFTLRAFLTGKKNLPQAEAVHAVIEAGTDSDLRHALDQLAGGITQPLEALRNDLLNLLADLEAALDFVDEDIEFVGSAETLTCLTVAVNQLAQLQHQLDERTISGRPIRVALVGRPNAGKSSLFNALAGGDAIVSPIPGTTRDYLTRRFELDGVTVELIDTAGWQPGTDTIENQAQELGRQAASQADVVLWCDENGQFPSEDANRLGGVGAEVIRVWTKCDLIQNLHEPTDRGISGGTDAVPVERGWRSGLSDQVEPTRTSAAVESDDAMSLGRTATDSANPSRLGDRIIRCSVRTPTGTTEVRSALTSLVLALSRPALAPSQSRCRHHVAACANHLRAAADHVATNDPPELAAAALRAALDQLGELTGAVFTNDLLDRIFSRFCIGK